MKVTLKEPHTAVSGISVNVDAPSVKVEFSDRHKHQLYSRPGVPDELLADIQQSLRILFENEKTVCTDCSCTAPLEADVRSRYALTKLLYSCVLYKDYSGYKILSVF